MKKVFILFLHKKVHKASDSLRMDKGFILMCYMFLENEFKHLLKACQ